MQVAQRRERKTRRDAGTVRQTARDAQMLELMAHTYGLPLDLVRAGLGVGMPRVYQLAQRWRDAGWVRMAQVDAGPSWVWPTREVARQMLGWDADWSPRATTTGHARAAAALRLHQVGLDLDRWISERTLRHEEGGYRRKGQTEKHTPDGVEILPDGRRVLIEVELTAKSPERYVVPGSSDAFPNGLLAEISNRAHDLGCSAVAYWCAPQIRPVVERAVAEFRRRDRGPQPVQWFVRDLSEVPGWSVERSG